MSSINKRIKHRRLSLGMTLLEVAEQLGVKEATVQRYESGEIKNIKHETIAALAKILKCSPAYIMGWEDEAEEPSTELSDFEKALIDKIRTLDEKGKHAVEVVVEMEYRRLINASHLTVVAAHNDDVSEEQIEMMQQDLEELKRIAAKKKKN